MNQDLMSPSGHEANGGKAKPFFDLNRGKMSDGRFSGGVHCHHFTLNRMPLDRLINYRFARIANADDKIVFFYFPLGEKVDKPTVRGGSLGRQKDSRSLFIQAVDNTRPQPI